MEDGRVGVVKIDPLLLGEATGDEPSLVHTGGLEFQYPVCANCSATSRELDQLKGVIYHKSVEFALHGSHPQLVLVRRQKLPKGAWNSGGVLSEIEGGVQSAEALCRVLLV
jgi:hypothetical protein